MSEEKRKSAEIHSLSKDAISPELFLDMIKANIPNIQSVAVSVLYKENAEDDAVYQASFNSFCTNAELAYHALRLQSFCSRVIDDAICDG